MIYNSRICATAPIRAAEYVLSSGLWGQIFETSCQFEANCAICSSPREFSSENVAGNCRVIFYCPICGSCWKIWKVPMTALSETFMRYQAMAQLQRLIKALPKKRRSFLTAGSASEDDCQH